MRITYRFKSITIHALAILAAFFTCTGCQGNGSGASGAAPEAKQMSIEDKTWQLAEVGGKRAEPVPADGEAVHFGLNSADKRVSGYGGVNQFNGTYELAGQSLRFGSIAMTRRAGPEKLMTQEFNLTQALSNTRSWRAAGDKRIELLDASGNAVAKFTTR